MTDLVIQRDKHSTTTFGVTTSDSKFRVLLAAGVESTLTVPAGKTRVLYAYSVGSNIWVKVNGVVTVPASAVFAADDSELNPILRDIEGGDVIHFIDENPGNVQVSFYDR